MAFIGNQPALAYTSFAVQHFTTSATTSYTLDYPVANENEIRLVINNVVQQPGSSYAYTASGTSLTLSAATTGTDTMYAVFLGKAVQTVNPPNGSVGLSQLSATGTKDSTTFLRGDNTFAVPAGGTNTPAFMANRTAGAQSFSSNTDTKYQASNEVIDTDSCYDPTTNYRFTPTTAGKYFIYFRVIMNFTGSTPSFTAGKIFKNGSEYAASVNNAYGSNPGQVTQHITSAIITFNGSTDYVESFINSNSSSPQAEGINTVSAEFGGYKLIGV